MKQHYDIVVVGGGMVGCAAAVGLAQHGLSVLLIESQRPQGYSADTLPDLRVSAINHGSVGVLKKLGAWKKLKQMRLHPYQRLSVWEDMQARCDFSASDIGQECLGYFVENRLLQLALLACAEQQSTLDVIFQQKVTRATFHRPCRLLLSHGQSVTSDWVIAADGARSSMREQAGIDVHGWHYKQEVLAVTLKMHSGEQDITWQQFAPTGPMAFLPLFENYAQLIWYHQAKHVHYCKSISLDALRKEIQNAFPQELGEFEVLQRSSFPIQRMHAQSYYHQGLVLIGDAAHSINPLAGQGVNLGFKDVDTLLKLFYTQGNPQTRLQSNRLFRAYEQSRRCDNALMMSVMDALYWSFSNRVMPIRKARNWGLRMANQVPYLKQQVLNYAAGIV